MRRALATLLLSLATLAAGCGGSGSPAGGGASTVFDPPAALLAAVAPADRPAARVYWSNGCGDCHLYAGEGMTSLGGPDLTHEGQLGRGIAWQVEHLKCPSCVVPGSAMPRFETLDSHNLRALALLLEHSR